MILFKVAPLFLFIIAVSCEKKIELQDIEEDNLKSEREKDQDKGHAGGPGIAPGMLSLDFLKNGLFRYFDGASPTRQPTRYVHQYSVTEEPSEQSLPIPPKPEYEVSASQHGAVTPQIAHHTQHTPLSHNTPQQAMVGYLSNVPMQIYLVPQYYNPGDTGVARASTFPTVDAGGIPNNYLDAQYVVPTPKAYIPQYTAQPVTYVGYNVPARTQSAPTHPSAPSTLVIPSPSPTTSVTYQVPMVQYQPVASAQHVQPAYYQQQQQYSQANLEEEISEPIAEQPKHYQSHSQVVVESPKHYPSHTEASYAKTPEAPRYYVSSTPTRDDFRQNHITELPQPSPLLLKAAPPHLAHIPKALPLHRPMSRPVYATSNHHVPAYSHRPTDPFVGHHGHYKRRPNSLLDSYIPSSVQVEYMKRGFTNDPLVAYEALSSGRHLSHASIAPAHYERGFLPNQMYHTAAGGVTFGHFKRSSKDKAPQSQH